MRDVATIVLVWPVAFAPGAFMKAPTGQVTERVLRRNGIGQHARKR